MQESFASGANWRERFAISAATPALSFRATALRVCLSAATNISDDQRAQLRPAVPEFE
jgi:hypothetical protein